MQLNDYTLSSDGTLKFIVITNSYGSLTADTASFESNATINVDATAAGFNSGTTNILLVSTTNGIISLQTTNLTASTRGRIELADAYVDTGGSNLIFEFTTQALKDYWSATGVFGEFSEELDSLATTEMYEIIDLINDPEISSRAVEQTYFTTFNTFQTAINGIRTAVGQSVARATELRDQKRTAPRGARGPRRRRGQQPESQIRGWGKYYGSYYTRSDSGRYPSYESGLHGGVLGIDASTGKLIIGISGGASRYETTFNNDARENTTATHGSLYGTYVAERGYIDAGIAYGINQVETRTANPFRLDGDFDAQVANFYLGGGYDLTDTRGGTVFTPEASIQYAMYKQDGYTETGTAAVPRMFDEFDADSLLSSIGINVAMQERKAMKTVAFQLDGRLHWMHEFNADPSNINFKLVGGDNSYPINYPSLDEEIYRIGVGCSFFNTSRRKPKNVVFRVDFDELFGDGFNSHNLSAKLIYAF
jgi:outer membrane autotransporter protein